MFSVFIIRIWSYVIGKLYYVDILLLSVCNLKLYDEIE